MQTGEQVEGGETAVEPCGYDEERGKTVANITHSVIQTKIAGRFDVQGEDRYWVGTELTVEFDDGLVLTPDIAVLPKRPLNYGLEPARCREVPLCVVEIFSPTQGYLEIMEKRELYFSHGVESVWVVQPASQSIDIYRPGEQRPQIIQQGEAKDPATGLSVHLERVFAGSTHAV